MPTHTVMKHSLAKALMESGMEHYDFGGIVNAVAAPVQLAAQIPNLLTNPGGTLGTAFSGIKSDYQAGAPNIQTQQLTPQIESEQKRLNDVYAQQQTLAQALLAQSQGQGPNLAQTQLANATGQNVNQQAALMASARGASANPGLIARQAAQQGAQAQQMAAGQSAALQAQQQLQAQNALGQQYAQQAGQGLQAQGILQNAQSAQNQAITGGQLGSQQINAGQSQANAGANAGLLGGLLSGAGAAGVAAASGGAKKADGGYASGPAYSGNYPVNSYLDGGKVPGKAPYDGNNIKNDTHQALLSSGEIVLPRSVTMAENPEEKAAEFVRHLKNKKGGYKEIAEGKRKK